LGDALNDVGFIQVHVSSSVAHEKTLAKLSGFPNVRGPTPVLPSMVFRTLDRVTNVEGSFHTHETTPGTQMLDLFLAKNLYLKLTQGVDQPAP